MITPEVSKSIAESVLAWLVTVSADGIPNVSPKEAFLEVDNQIIIANVASPKSVENIKANPNVCLSFINIFTQKGHKITGLSRMIETDAPEFPVLRDKLQQIVSEDRPILSLISIEPCLIEPIVAPSYTIHPNLTETEMIIQSASTYQLRKYQAIAEQDATPAP